MSEVTLTFKYLVITFNIGWPLVNKSVNLLCVSIFQNLIPGVLFKGGLTKLLKLANVLDLLDNV